MPTIIKEDCLTEDEVLKSIANNLSQLNLYNFKFGNSDDKSIYPVIWQSLGRIKGCNDARGWLKRKLSKVMGKVGSSLTKFAKEKTVSQFDKTMVGIQSLLSSCNSKSTLKKISKTLSSSPFAMIVMNHSLPEQKDDRKKIIEWVGKRNITSISQLQSMIGQDKNDLLRQLLENYSDTIETKLETMAVKIGKQASITEKKLKHK